jgi:pimeloyl-ACP methyl ester carboxylesterase
MVAALRASVQTGAAESAAEALIDWVQWGPGGFRRLPRATRERLRTNAATLGPTYAAPAPVATCGQLRALRLPVLTLRGEQTRPWYRVIAQAAADGIPSAESAVIPAARHMAIVGNPGGSAGLPARFIARHSSGSGATARGYAEWAGQDLVDDLASKSGLRLARGEYAALERRMRTLESVR